MKKILILVILTAVLYTCESNKKPSEITVLGTVHFPTKYVTPDSIFKVLKKVNPDIIAMEADSSVFNPDFTFNKTYDENEYEAVLKYLETKPEVMIRPIGFEGRNAYRKSIGIYPEAGFVYNILWDLVDADSLSKHQTDMMYHFESLWSVMEVYKNETLKHINQKEVDRLIDSINLYQYSKLKPLINNRSEFEGRILDAHKDTVTLKSYFEKWSRFEGAQRNEAMANNLLTIIRQHPNKRIIVLTGFKHRASLLKALKTQQIELDFDIKEFYDY